MSEITDLRSIVTAPGKMLEAILQSLKSLEAVHSSFLKQDATVIKQFESMDRWIQAQRIWMKQTQAAIDEMQAELKIMRRNPQIGFE